MDGGQTHMARDRSHQLIRAKCQKLQRRMMEFGQFACRGDLDTILCPWCNILRAGIGTGSSPIKDIQGDFYSLFDYTYSKFL